MFVSPVLDGYIKLGFPGLPTATTRGNPKLKTGHGHIQNRDVTQSWLTVLLVQPAAPCSGPGADAKSSALVAVAAPPATTVENTSCSATAYWQTLAYGSGDRWNANGFDAIQTLCCILLATASGVQARHFAYRAHSLCIRGVVALWYPGRRSCSPHHRSMPPLVVAGATAASNPTHLVAIPGTIQHIITGVWRRVLGTPMRFPSGMIRFRRLCNCWHPRNHNPNGVSYAANQLPDTSRRLVPSHITCNLLFAFLCPHLYVCVGYQASSWRAS